ncbi:hypothetical protein PYW08_000073 [Mythimna loreyi]|uniref:Uncharacterized protein n=1 Tax=Mythimna loreyi TaxID=667449 RepID=A0ACC2RBV5_9NEOP|nr:hypothetical protein PYW08_000073 [Mythimna loreyi]
MNIIIIIQLDISQNYLLVQYSPQNTPSPIPHLAKFPEVGPNQVLHSFFYLQVKERKKDACARIRFCAALRQSDLDSRTPMTSLTNFYSSSWHSEAHRGIDDQLFCRDGKITIDKN